MLALKAKDLRSEKLLQSRGDCCSEGDEGSTVDELAGYYLLLPVETVGAGQQVHPKKLMMHQSWLSCGQLSCREMGGKGHLGKALFQQGDL